MGMWDDIHELSAALDALHGRTVEVKVKAKQTDDSDLAAEGRRIQLALDAYQQRIGRR